MVRSALPALSLHHVSLIKLFTKMEKTKKSWAKSNEFVARRSAQSYLNANQNVTTASPCGTSCGSGDDGGKKISPCGTSCGSGDDPKK